MEPIEDIVARACVRYFEHRGRDILRSESTRLRPRIEALQRSGLLQPRNELRDVRVRSVRECAEWIAHRIYLFAPLSGAADGWELLVFGEKGIALQEAYTQFLRRQVQERPELLADLLECSLVVEHSKR